MPNIKDMNDKQLAEYAISSIRKGDGSAIDAIKEVRGDLQQFINECVNKYPSIERLLFNQELVAAIDSGGPFGHVYMGIPDEQGGMRWWGFDPKEDGQAIGKGKVRDEVESGRIAKNYPTVQKTLAISEEGWKKAIEFVKYKIANPGTYVLAIADKNCANFVHEAIKTAGLHSGLVDVFNTEDLAKLHGDSKRAILAIQQHVLDQYITNKTMPSTLQVSRSPDDDHTKPLRQGMIDQIEQRSHEVMRARAIKTAIERLLDRLPKVVLLPKQRTFSLSGNLQQIENIKNNPYLDKEKKAIILSRLGASLEDIKKFQEETAGVYTALQEYVTETGKLLKSKL